MRYCYGQGLRVGIIFDFYIFWCVGIRSLRQKTKTVKANNNTQKMPVEITDFFPW